MTDKLERILVPLDGSKNSQRGLEMAIKMAGQSSASITGLISIDTTSRSEFGAGSTSNEIPDDVHDIMKHAESQVAKSGVTFKSKIMHGNTGYNIIKMAHSTKEKFDMVVIGSRGRGALKEMFFGSVSNYVIHTSKIPVLIVK